MAGPPDLRHRRGLDRAPQHEVEQRVDRGPVEVVEVDAADPGPQPQRLDARGERFGGPHGAHQEDEVGVDELGHQGRRRGVEEVQVVDEQDHRAGGRLTEEHRTDLGHHRYEVAALVAEPGRQQVGERTQRHGPGAFRGRGAGHGAALAVGKRQALVGEAGLAHARPAVDHEAVRPRIGEGGSERVEFAVAAHERPLQRGNCDRGGRAGPGHQAERYRRASATAGQPVARGPEVSGYGRAGRAA